MGNADLVRASRDGGQFHYLWASRKALLLLSPVSGLHTLTKECLQNRWLFTSNKISQR